MNIRNAMPAVAAPLVLAALGLAGNADATENGIPTTVNGFYDFGAGMSPPPTPFGTISLRSSYNHATVRKNQYGETLDDDFSLSVFTMSAAYLRMTRATLLGASYGFGIVQPFFRMDAAFDVQTPAGPLRLRGETFRIADTLLLPLILQWNPSPNLHLNAQFQVLAPTGDYDKRRLVNPGLNHWAFSPIFNFTYITDGGFEVSSSFEVDISTRNHASGYRNGIEYRHEFALGQHVGPWTLGVGGYYSRQFTDDDAPGLQGGNRSRAIALGPAVHFYKPGLPPVWLHVYKEFGARNRAEGYTAALRLAASF
jgi:hypothetical protein